MEATATSANVRSWFDAEWDKGRRRRTGSKVDHLCLLETTDGSHTLEFVWTVSRGRDTYGYNICSLYVDGLKASSCNGGGYDMQGTCLGEWFEQVESSALKQLAKDRDSRSQESGHRELYGLFYSAERDKVWLDGACGFSSIERIISALGYKLRQVR